MIEPANFRNAGGYVMRSFMLLAATFLIVATAAFCYKAHGKTSPQSAAADLGGTSWQLVKFQGSDNKTLIPDDKTKYTIVFEADGGGVTARIDCTVGVATWRSVGQNQLQFGPLRLGRAVCPPGSVGRIVTDWRFVRSYTIKDGHLFLALMADGGIYEFEPMTGSKRAARMSPVASTGTVSYECANSGGGKDTLTATFYESTPAMVLVERFHPDSACGNQTRPAFQVPAASGTKYQGQDLTFWDTQEEALVTWSGTDLKCKPR